MLIVMEVQTCIIKVLLMLHTLRTLVNNDSLWFEIIYNIANNFKYKAIDGNEIINYIKKKTGKELTAFLINI